MFTALMQWTDWHSAVWCATFTGYTRAEWLHKGEFRLYGQDGTKNDAKKLSRVLCVVYFALINSENVGLYLGR